LYNRRQQREILEMHHTQFPFLGTMPILQDFEA